MRRSLGVGLLVAMMVILGVSPTLAVAKAKAVPAKGTTQVAPAEAAPAPQAPVKKEEQKIKIRYETVGGWQALTQSKTDGSLPPLRTGFPAALSNLKFWTTLSPEIDIYGDLYISTRNHLGTLYAREGYMLVKELPESLNAFNMNRFFDVIDIKAGHFEVDFGHRFQEYRSDNASVFGNPLVGSFVADPSGAEGGFEVIAHKGLLHGSAGIGTGMTTESFLANRGYSLHGKVWIEPEDKSYSLSGSLYTVDHSGTPTAGGTSSELVAANRSNSRYGTVVDNNTTAGQPNFGKGKKELDVMIDGSVKLGKWDLYGMWGAMRDADTNGSDAGALSERWQWYGIQAKYDLCPKTYAAARFSGAAASMIAGVPMNAQIQRIQLGLGYWALENMLLKAEYVTQTYTGFTAGTYTKDPRFSGVIFEVATWFGN